MAAEEQRWTDATLYWRAAIYKIRKHAGCVNVYNILESCQLLQLADENDEEQGEICYTLSYYDLLRRRLWWQVCIQTATRWHWHSPKAAFIVC